MRSFFNFFFPFSFFFVEIESHYIALAGLELCSTDQAGLELGDPSASAFQILGVKVYTTLPDSLFPS